MPLPGQKMQPGRKRLVGTITKYIRDRYPRVLENDDIADALGLERHQVRNSIRNYMNEHPGEFVEDGPYRYVAVTPNNHHTAPVSGAPVATTPAFVHGLRQAMNDDDAPTFRFLTIVQDGAVLLQDQDKNVWKATLL